MDIPFGTGRFIDIYLKNSLEVMGVDISKDMLMQAEKKLKNVKHSVKTIESDIINLPFENHYFDFIICFRLFHLLPFEIIEKAVKEISRVAKNKIYIEIYKSSLIPETNQNKKNRLKMKLQAFIQKFAKEKKNTKEKTQPWLEIQNFSYYEKNLLNLFMKNNLNLEKIEEITEDKNNEIKIYILSK